MTTARGNPRLQVGSASWISEERSSALQVAEAESEEFSFSARNEMDWLNEHIAEIFSENQVNVAEIFKTPGKLRGKTPRTVRKANPLETRTPLSDVFSATPRGNPSPFRQTPLEKPVPTFQVAEDEPEALGLELPANKSSTERLITTKPPPSYLADSGYFGSQWNDASQATQANDPVPIHCSPHAATPSVSSVAYLPVENDFATSRSSDDRRTTEASFQSAKEEQARKLSGDVASREGSPQRNIELEKPQSPALQLQPLQRFQLTPSPKRRPSQQPIAVAEPPSIDTQQEEPGHLEEAAPAVADDNVDDVPSPSDGSSPIRPIVRKSSLNFASLPAREPITTKKSIGNRASRTSHLDQTRISYYGRPTGGKSLGNVMQDIPHSPEGDEIDQDEGRQEDTDDGSKIFRLHSKTSTQRLQDQISMLGKSQPTSRPASKPAVSSGAAPPQANQPNGNATQDATQWGSPIRESPQRRPFVAPGAFPEEEYSWIAPPAAEPAERSVFSPRPHMTKNHSTDVMEGIHGSRSIAGEQFDINKQGGDRSQLSPFREPAALERTTGTLGHIKSVSTSVLRSPKKAGESPERQKTISVSNPNLSTKPANSTTPPKSPSRNQRGSPLKAAKDKFSSILKTSRGLFASSAAVSADAKTSTMSPATSRLGLNSQPSFEEVLQNSQAYRNHDSNHNIQNPNHVFYSPAQDSLRRTRASVEREERERQEEAREAREAHDSQKAAEQLEKARQKVKEEARLHHLEQERVAAMQKEVLARKEQENLVKSSQSSVPRATRSSPRKTKAQLEAERVATGRPDAGAPPNRDVEMSDVSTIPLPAASTDAPRPKSQMGRPPAKRPLKPAKEQPGRAKPPTVIRVDTGSQRGHQYHPTNSTLASTLQDTLAAPTPGSSQGLRNKASTGSIQSKASTGSFKSAATKALEAAARKKEQDELVAQRKREAKQEVERQRAANKEEERRKEELARRQEAERQRAVQREREQAASLADAKKAASRQAIEKRRLEVEKAKQTTAPPPAIRPQPSGDLTFAMLQDKPQPQPRNDMGQAKGTGPMPSVHRSYDDHSRPVNSMLHNTAKVPPKRPLPQDAGDEHHSRPVLQRNPPSYHNDTHHQKRRKTSETFDDPDEGMAVPQPKMTAPPIRQSSSRPKDIATKSIFQSGYGNAPAPANLQRAAVMAQHQSKPAHPMDMTQISKGPIPFATSSTQANAQHKTPARPGQAAQAGKGKSAVKSAAKSSPRYQNGDNIELPEIHTDSEDEDSDGGNDFVALGWTNSPDLRKQLAKQETIDPAEVFGQPAPLNMEEVFSKSKDRFHKFRARTSSANWSGTDRLTDDEVRKDLEARDRVRRQGGWTYDSMV